MKVNLCCGMDYRDGYTNVDFSNVGSDGSPIRVDVVCNILEGLPFRDNSVSELIFHESLEHFNRWNGVEIMKSIYGCMKGGGILSLTVPNAEKQMKMLLVRMSEKLTFDDFLNAHSRWNYWKFHDDLAGATHRSDGFDGDSHKTFYTKSSLISVLEHVGFKIEEIKVDSSIRVRAKK